VNKKVENLGRGLFQPLVKLLLKLKVSPNLITFIGLPVTLLSAFLYAIGKIRLAGLILAFAGLFDVLDGEVARRSNRVSKFGAFFDSTIDRFEEFFVFGGILYYSGFELKNLAYFALVYLILLGSIMTSYVRARAEGVGYCPRSGPMDRPGRYLFLIAVSLLGERVLFYSLPILLVLVFWTVINRFKEFRNLIREKEG